MHKTADELAQDDLFIMAGQLYRVLETYETVDERLTKFAFVRVGDESRTRSVMTVKSDSLFALS